MKNTRTCMLCKKKDSKKKLFRIVSKNGIAVLDDIQKVNQRGTYLCKNSNCVNNYIKALNKNKINTKLEFEKESMIKLLEDLKEKLGE